MLADQPPLTLPVDRQLADADFEHGVDDIHLADYREENGGAKLTLYQLLITRVGTTPASNSISIGTASPT